MKILNRLRDMRHEKETYLSQQEYLSTPYYFEETLEKHNSLFESSTTHQEKDLKNLNSSAYKQKT